jgi:hypothetical protein
MEIATPLTAAVLQRRLERQELTVPPLDSQNRRLFSLPCAVVQRAMFIPDPVVVEDDRDAYVPTWHYHRGTR